MFQLQTCPLISVTCPMDTRKAHTVPYNELCHHLWDSFGTHFTHTSLWSSWSWTILCTSQWMSSSLATSAAERISMPCMICRGHAWCQHVLPLLIAMHRICLFAQYYRYSIHHLQLALGFYWCNTHHTQKSKHTSHFKVCHGSGRPSIFNLTYLWYPLIAVPSHNLHVLITCLNLQSHDTISCQTCCCLIFWNFLVCLSEIKTQNMVQGTHPHCLITFITTNVVINYKYADTYNVNTWL